MHSLDDPTVHATRRDVHNQTTRPLPAAGLWQDVSSIKRHLIFICSLFLVSLVSLVLGYQSSSTVCFATATASCIITLSSMIARDASPYATFGWYIIWVLLYISCFIMSRWGEPIIDDYTRFPEAGSFTHVLTRLYHLAIFSRVNAQILRSLKHCLVDGGRWNRWLQMNKVSALTLLDVLVLPMVYNDPSKHRYLRIFNAVDSAVVGFHSVSLLGLLGMAAWMVNQPNSERPVRRLLKGIRWVVLFVLLLWVRQNLGSLVYAYVSGSTDPSDVGKYIMAISFLDMIFNSGFIACTLAVDQVHQSMERLLPSWLEKGEKDQATEV